jgi:hypothetical protein
MPVDSGTHVVELIARSLDEPLTPAERAQVNQHLDACITCRIAADALREFDSLLTRTRMVRPPEGFPLRVLDRIALYERRQHRIQWILTLLLIFLGSVLASVWVVTNLGAVLNTLGVLVFTVQSAVPVWLEALFVVARAAGQGGLFASAVLVLVLTIVIARLAGDFAPLAVHDL